MSFTLKYSAYDCKGFDTAPMASFRHAPLCDTWASDVSVGMKVSTIDPCTSHRYFLEAIAH